MTEIKGAKVYGTNKILREIFSSKQNENFHLGGVYAKKVNMLEIFQKDFKEIICT